MNLRKLAVCLIILGGLVGAFLAGLYSKRINNRLPYVIEVGTVNISSNKITFYLRQQRRPVPTNSISSFRFNGNSLLLPISKKNDWHMRYANELLENPNNARSFEIKERPDLIFVVVPAGGR